jgi:hypothetical protein
MASPYQFKPYAAINPRIDNDSYAVTASSISELLHSGDYSDLQIICRDEVYNVHRAIVCPRSKVIETKLKRWHFHVSKMTCQDGSMTPNSDRIRKLHNSTCQSIIPGP